MLPVRRSASGQLGLLRILDFTSTVCVRFVSLHATDRPVHCLYEACSSNVLNYQSFRVLDQTRARSEWGFLHPVASMLYKFELNS